MYSSREVVQVVATDINPTACLIGFPLYAKKTTARRFEPLRAEPNGFRVHLLNRSDTLSYVHRKHWVVLDSLVATSAWQAVAFRGFLSRTFCDAALRLEQANQFAKTWQHGRSRTPVSKQALEGIEQTICARIGPLK